MTTPLHNQTQLFPSCSIIIPTRDSVEILRPCIESVLQSPYSGEFEILVVDNGSTDPDTLSYLNAVRSDNRVTVIRWDKPFNYSEINNMAAREARGDILCFLNNDTVVKTPSWLDVLAPMAARDKVGAVGALLLYPDNTVQHAGVALDKSYIGQHIAHQVPMQELEQRFQLDRGYSVDAVTAACLLTRRELFLALDGFDAEHLAVSFNDIDYCLRLRAAGYASIIVPSAQLYHYESVTRKSDDLPENRPRAVREKNVMLERWQHWIALCAYNGSIDWAPRTDRVQNVDTVAATPVFSIPNEPLLPPSVVLTIDQQTVADHLQRPRDHDDSQHEYEAVNTTALDEQSTLASSGFVRNTWRRLRHLKQRAGLALISTDWGRRLYYMIKGQRPAVTPTAPVVDVELLKAQHSEAARMGLDQFLGSSESLVLPQSDRPELSIILVLFNQAPLTLLCLRSLIDNTDVAAEIIIVDNNSTDDSADMMAKVQGAKLIHNAENVGFVHAVNQGAAAAKGKHLLLLNNDALLQPGSLRAALEVFASEDKVGAVGGRIRLLDGTLQEAGSIIWQDGACLGYGRGQDPQSAEYMFRRDVDYCSGAFLMIPRSLFNELDGFDVDFAPAYYEESDFCIRLIKAGYRIIYEPDADIIHYEFASSGGYSGASQLQQEHRQVLCAKHPDFLTNQYAFATENILRARSRSPGSRVLVIDDRVPHVSLGSGYPRCREMLHEMEAIGLHVTLYPLQFATDDWAQTYQTLSRSIEVMLNWGNDRLAEFLTQRRGYYDHIVISRNHNMKRFNEILRKNPSISGDARIIYDSEALTAPREVLAMRLTGQTVSAAREQTMINAEVELARDADCVVTVSEAEADTYRNAGFDNLLALGHKAQAAPTPAAFTDRINFLFVGALRDDNSPNVDSLIWFCDRILPLIQQRLRNAVSLVVVGDNTAPAIQRLASPSVRFMGRQDDLTTLYDRSRVFIAPTRFAAGIPHKIHEAAAHGIPVVATTLLASQLSWTNNLELLTADEEQEFADQCARIYTDAELWQSLRDNALVALGRDCSPQQFRANLKRMFDIAL